jgi:hypothetical protein
MNIPSLPLPCEVVAVVIPIFSVKIWRGDVTYPVLQRRKGVEPRLLFSESPVPSSLCDQECRDYYCLLHSFCPFSFVTEPQLYLGWQCVQLFSASLQLHVQCDLVQWDFQKSPSNKMQTILGREIFLRKKARTENVVERDRSLVPGNTEGHALATSKLPFSL